MFRIVASTKDFDSFILFKGVKLKVKGDKSLFKGEGYRITSPRDGGCIQRIQEVWLEDDEIHIVDQITYDGMLFAMERIHNAFVDGMKYFVNIIEVLRP